MKSQLTTTALATIITLMTAPTFAADDIPTDSSSTIAEAPMTGDAGDASVQGGEENDDVSAPSQTADSADASDSSTESCGIAN